jgi:hypothetical protein
MKGENSGQILKRIASTAVIMQIVLGLIIYIFTKRAIYSIICFIAATICVTGFVIMIKLIDKILKTNRGRGLFFLFQLGKMALIAALFIPISKVSETAVILYIIGLSMIPLAILIEAGHQLFRKKVNGT